MLPYKLSVLDKAQRDALRIKAYIKYILFNNKAADDFVRALDEKYKQIIKSPHVYPQRLFGNRLYRFAMVKRYLVVFRIDEDTHTVHIIAIGHCLQKRKNIVKDK